MSAFAQASRIAAAAALIAGAVGAAGADAPARVVSMNLCTDLLAMTLGPEQLISVSPLARDETSSALAAEAQAFPANTGSAEEIFLLAPDLVLAGSFTERSTVQMLRQLGIEVAEFPPVTSLDEMRAQMRRMGQLLGQDAAAEREIAAFDQGLAALAVTGTDRPVAVPYFANGYALGEGTLVAAVLDAAGLANGAAMTGLSGGGQIGMEALVIMAPDVIVTGARYPAASRSEAILDHPALRSATGGREVVVIPDRDWICGTPHLLAAITRLAQVAEGLR
jgi:iron complex transport system substrate-binding protein